MYRRLFTQLSEWEVGDSCQKFRFIVAVGYCRFLRTSPRSSSPSIFDRIEQSDPSTSSQPTLEDVKENTYYHNNHTIAHRTPTKMGLDELMKILKTHSDYHTSSSGMPHYRRLEESEIASMNAMEGCPSADHSASTSEIIQQDRPQYSTTLAPHRSASRVRATRFKKSLTFRLWPFRTPSKEALAASKLSPLAKGTLDLLSGDLDGSPFLGDVSTSSSSLATRQSNRSQHAPGQEPASSPRSIGFKQALEHCLTILEELEIEAEGWSNPSEPAGEYFKLIAADIERELVHLRSWAKDDIRVWDPGLGDSVPENATGFMTDSLKRTISAAEEIRKEMEYLGSLASKGRIEPTGKDIEDVDSLAGQDSVEEVVKDPKVLDSLAAQRRLADLAVEL